MAYTASWPVERPTVLGLVAAAVWLVGLVVGVSELAAGHLLVAAVRWSWPWSRPGWGWRGICMAASGPTESHCRSSPAARSPQADLRAWPGCFADRLVCNFFVSFCFTRVDRTPRGYRLSYG